MDRYEIIKIYFEKEPFQLQSGGGILSHESGDGYLPHR